MTITLDIPQDAESELRRRAERAGLPVEEIARPLLVAAIFQPSEDRQRLEAARSQPRNRAILSMTSAERRALRHQMIADAPPAPVLSDSAFDREELYP
jgi:hypothetical protein